MEILVEIIGWTGSGLVITAYLLNIQDKLPTGSLAYRWMNITGGGCLVVLTLYHRAFPAAVENALWMAIGLVALFRSKK